MYKSYYGEIFYAKFYAEIFVFVNFIHTNSYKLVVFCGRTLKNPSRADT